MWEMSVRKWQVATTKKGRQEKKKIHPETWLRMFLLDFHRIKEMTSHSTTIFCKY